MLKSVICAVKEKLRQKRIQKELGNRGIELHCPFTITNVNNLVAESPVYIGPESWLSLRGKLLIGGGYNNRATIEDSHIKSSLARKNVALRRCV